MTRTDLAVLRGSAVLVACGVAAWWILDAGPWPLLGALLGIPYAARAYRRHGRGPSPTERRQP